MTEWNLTHHLANEIAKYIFWLDHDIDVVKHPSHQRPDIIFHKRGKHSFNFLVIEAKINRLDINNDDKEKIKTKWMANELCYQYRYGVCISIVNKEYNGLILNRDDNNNFIETHFNNLQTSYIKLPKKRSKSNLINQVNNSNNITEINDLILDYYNNSQ